MADRTVEERFEMKQIQPYEADHSTSSVANSLVSAQIVVPLVMELVQPKSVIDIGCGMGAWLSVFKEHGVEVILGVDGNYVNVEMLKIPQKHFLAYDLGQPLKIEQSFDLVLSLEVAEHLPIEKAETFIDTLVSLGSVILFSAAVPFQPGDDHVNGQWPAYWANIFNQRGYVSVDCLRMKFWQNKDVQWWYSQNMLLFVKESCLQDYPLLEHNFKNTKLVAPLSLIHPELYLMQQGQIQADCLNPNSCSVGQAWSLFIYVLINRFKNQLSKVMQAK